MTCAIHVNPRPTRAAVVPRVSEEPLSLNHTGARTKLRKRDISFICVRIKVGNEVIGALSAGRLFSGAMPFEEDVRLLSIIASMIAQAGRLRQAASGTGHSGSLQGALEAMERKLIIDALKAARGNKVRAAQALGTTRGSWA